MAAGGRARGAGTRRATTRRAFGSTGAGAGCTSAVGIAGTGHDGFTRKGTRKLLEGLCGCYAKKSQGRLKISELSVRSSPADPEFSVRAF